MVTFDYYINEYGGAAIEDQEDFARYSDMAQRYVSRQTDGRASDSDDDVKNCICAVSEVFSDYLYTTGIERENSDGYELSYREGAMYEVLKHTCELYLPPMLLYRGFD